MTDTLTGAPSCEGGVEVSEAWDCTSISRSWYCGNVGPAVNVNTAGEVLVASWVCEVVVEVSARGVEGGADAGGWRGVASDAGGSLRAAAGVELRSRLSVSPLSSSSPV